MHEQFPLHPENFLISSRHHRWLISHARSLVIYICLLAQAAAEKLFFVFLFPRALNKSLILFRQWRLAVNLKFHFLNTESDSLVIHSDKGGDSRTHRQYFYFCDLIFLKY